MRPSRPGISRRGRKIRCIVSGFLRRASHAVQEQAGSSKQSKAIQWRVSRNGGRRAMVWHQQAHPGSLPSRPAGWH